MRLHLASALALVLVSPQALAHDIYSGLKSPDNGTPCCNDRDCQRTSMCILADGTEGIVSPSKGCIPVPWERTMSRPDTETHICEWNGIPTCVLMGGGS